jgi:2-iminobutanoate/2-iminopropanoate deaminase
MLQKKVIEPNVYPFYDYKKYSISLALKKGDYLFLSGHTASQYDHGSRKVMCKGNILDQVRVAYDKIKLLVEVAGGSLDDVVKMTDYVAPSGFEKYKYVGQVRRKYFGNKLPAVTTVVVDHLLRDALIEVEAVAVVGKSKKEVFIPSLPSDKKHELSLAVKKGDLLFLSGQMGTECENGNAVAEGDTFAQTERAYRSIEAVLEASGADLRDVVVTQYYFPSKALMKYEEIQKISAQHFKGNYSASTGVGIKHLIPESALIEIDCIAVLGDARKVRYPLSWPHCQDPTCCSAVKKGNLIFISGVVGIDMDTSEIVGEGNVVRQTEQIYKNIEKIVDFFGASRDDVLRTVDFVMPEAERNYRGTADVRREYFGGVFPASTGVFVEKLLLQEALIEVDAVAVSD